MYTYYVIKLYLVNGDWGYACYGGMSKDINSSMFFDTYDEARNWYEKNDRYALYGGIRVDHSNSKIVSVSSRNPI